MSTGLVQSGNILVQSVALAQNALTVTFSPEGTWLLGLGQLSLMGNGSRPILVDAAGRIVEHARLTSNVIQTVAAISSAVVSVAHVISAADLAHRMKQMEPKLDLLIAYRRIDQEAKLERVFYAARELCAGPISPDERQRLWQLRQELRELRIVLRKEWQRELEQIAQQQVAPLDILHLLGKREKKEKLYQQQWREKCDQTLIYPFLIEFMLRFEVVLAMASRDEVAYSQLLRDELTAIEQVVQYFEVNAAILTISLLSIIAHCLAIIGSLVRRWVVSRQT